MCRLGQARGGLSDAPLTSRESRQACSQSRGLRCCDALRLCCCKGPAGESLTPKTSTVGMQQDIEPLPHSALGWSHAALQGMCSPADKVWQPSHTQNCPNQFNKQYVQEKPHAPEHMGSGLGVYAQGAGSVVGGVRQAVPVGPALQRAAVPNALPAAASYSQGLLCLFTFSKTQSEDEVEILVIRPRTEVMEFSQSPAFCVRCIHGRCSGD